MSRFLLVYCSHFGRTRTIANLIAHRLRELGDTVDVVDARGGALYVRPRDYDAVIAGSRIEFGRFAGGLIEYLKEYRDMLEAMPTALFSVSMAAAAARTQGIGCDPSGYNQALCDDLEWRPTESAAFAGGLPYRTYNWFVRQVMKRISQGAGHTTDTTRDHVFTDDSAVIALADSMHGHLHGPRVTKAPEHRFV